MSQTVLLTFPRRIFHYSDLVKFHKESSILSSKSSATWCFEGTKPSVICIHARGFLCNFIASSLFKLRDLKKNMKNIGRKFNENPERYFFPV